MPDNTWISRTHGVVAAAGTLMLASTLMAADIKNGFDLSDALVPATEIHWGGVSRDGIPSINNPRFVAASDADFLKDKDRVLGVYRNGFAKAYPVKILDRHEVVNDRFGDEAITVTYCPLCYSGMTFSAQAGHKHLTFGVSGLLYNSDVLLYDHQSGSLWSQIGSHAISGPLKGVRIEPIPTAHRSWREWRERYPDTQVLSTDTGFRINYRTSPYKDYHRSARLMFPVNNRSRDYRNKELVLGIRIGGVQKAYPFKELRKHGLESFGDSVGESKVTIEWFKDDGYARAVDGNGEEIATVILYWFAWYAFHPDTAVFQAAQGAINSK